VGLRAARNPESFKQERGTMGGIGEAVRPAGQTNARLWSGRNGVKKKRKEEPEHIGVTTWEGVTPEWGG